MTDTITVSVQEYGQSQCGIEDMLNMFKHCCEWIQHNVPANIVGNREISDEAFHRMLIEEKMPSNLVSKAIAKVAKGRRNGEQINHRYIMFNSHMINVNMDDQTITINLGNKKKPLNLCLEMNCTNGQRFLIRNRRIKSMLFIKKVSECIVSFRLYDKASEQNTLTFD